MKIQSSQISMTSQYLSAEKYEYSESLRVWVGDGDLITDESTDESQSPFFRIQDKVTISSSRSVEESMLYDKQNKIGHADPKTEMIRLLFEKLTGRKIKLLSLDEFEPRARQQPDAPPQPDDAQQSPSGAGFGLAYEKHESYSETEAMEFTSKGVLLTEDGREIRFELHLAMSRSYTEREGVRILLGDAAKIDPLVVNLDGQSAALQDAFFYFDLNADGVEEKMAALGPGKGFLVMDKNQDGIITDGTELFGPSTGNGFTELAQYDADKNQWIDENDWVYSLLGVWRRDPAGIEELSSFKDAGIGALYAGKIETPFSLRNSENEAMGELRETGFYLKDDGTAGTIQELDLLV